ncbi:hypothetical protein [Silvibacterium acidisoli]|uniref:hypothetical protein n=1 Tax=Acidobacteriaceae bacterium ZG23-2 TaxID=2883246 RepID=UPI00406D0BA6
MRRSLPLALALASALIAQTPATPQPKDARIFQTGSPWTPRININADMVLVYGINNNVGDRIRSWREHGYRTAVMTGVAWGEYGPYLRGDFDGKEHWDETQQEKSGKLILHSGREVPYVAPSIAYGKYLAKGVEAALDAGAEAIYLEEPEFWARAGWSESFKREWQDFYHEPWQAPDSSPDAQYRASKLKYFLYRRALAQVFQSVQEYGKTHHRTIPCYVATHSLLNYAQWEIVSPESSLLDVGADGYIAQVWTGTSRTPNSFNGDTRERTFETAFLEYGALQNIARSSGKPIWYLNDPIEDNPNHSWTDYRTNWESTLTASLLQPVVYRYELLPWPERIFGPRGKHLLTDTSTEKVPIPQTYATELQTVFHALGEMKQPASSVHWEAAGTESIGVLASDTLMFQRAQPEPSDEGLGQFYGLAMPLLMRGMPVEPVQIESAYKNDAATGSLNRYKILLLTYDGQKPPSPAFHAALAAWVKAGGALVVVDDDSDPYNHAKDWWNSNGNHYATPREDLFAKLGLAAEATGMNHIGKGFVIYDHQSPSKLSHSSDDGELVNQLVQTAADAIHLELKDSRALVLRRGPYVVAAGLEDKNNTTQATVRGDLINLFDANLAESHSIDVHTGERYFLLDVNAIHDKAPRVIAASGNVTNEHFAARKLTFSVDGIDQTDGVVRILSAKAPRSVSLDGKPLAAGQYQQSGRTVLVHFPLTAAAQKLEVEF